MPPPLRNPNFTLDIVLSRKKVSQQQSIFQKMKFGPIPQTISKYAPAFLHVTAPRKVFNLFFKTYISLLFIGVNALCWFCLRQSFLFVVLEWIKVSKEQCITSQN